MKFLIVILLIFIHNLNLITCDIPQSQKNSIDILLPFYELTPIPSGGDYCGLPQNFKCDTTSTSIIEINLIGDVNGFPTFPNQVIDKFIDISIINITNSIILESFFTQIPNAYFTLSLDNCILQTFPINIKNITSLYMNDVSFNGDIQITTLYKLDNFFLTYSSSDLISNYQFVGFVENYVPIQPTVYKVTLNNLYKFTTITYKKFIIILGKHFDSDFSNLGTLTTNQCEIIDVGHFNQPISVSEFNISKTSNIEFKNINFEFPSDNNYFSIETYTKKNSLIFDNCTGLTDLNNDFKLNLTNVWYLSFKNSKLVKFPSASFYTKLGLLDLSGNLLSGPLPNLIDPENSEQVLNFNLSNNQFTGTLTQNYCYHYVDFRNNQISGDLPMCYICGLNDSYLRNYINGNNFSNYISDSTNGFPQCTGISFASKAKFRTLDFDIYGTNFGWDTLNPIYFPYSIVSTPFINLSPQIPNKRILLRYGYSSELYEQLKLTGFKAILLFKIPNQNVTLELEILPPFVNSSQASPYYNEGFIFTIYGEGFTFSKSGYNTTVTFGELPTYTLSSSGNILTFMISQFQLAEKVYNVTIYNGQTGLSLSYQYKFERTYPYVSAVYPPSREGGIVTLFGSYGPNHHNVSIYIGDQECEVKSKNSSIITCTIGSGSGVKSLNLTVDSTQWNAGDVFRYKEDELPCIKGCNNGGSCYNGVCICKSGFSGITCYDKLTSIEVKKNDTLTEIIKNGYSFGFSIRDIKEIDFNGITVRQHNFTKWDLTDDSTLQKWTYTNKYGNSLISYTIEQIIDEAKNFTFAGELMTLQPGSLKLTASIDNWEYLGSLNTLQLQIQSSTAKVEENECKSKSIIETNSDGSSLNYITIKKGNNVFNGRFIDKVESDGRPTFSRVTVSEQTEDSITVSLSLPYCKQCKIDPDFSVMISPNLSPDECGQPASNLKWVIPVSVILGLLGLFGISVGFFFLLRNRIYISRKGGVILLRKTKTGDKPPLQTPIGED